MSGDSLDILRRIAYSLVRSRDFETMELLRIYDAKFLDITNDANYIKRAAKQWRLCEDITTFDELKEQYEVSKIIDGCSIIEITRKIRYWNTIILDNKLDMDLFSLEWYAHALRMPSSFKTLCFNTEYNIFEKDDAIVRMVVMLLAINNDDILNELINKINSSNCQHIYLKYIGIGYAIGNVNIKLTQIHDLDNQYLIWKQLIK